MKTQKIIGKITALAPVHHGGDEKTGSETLLRRIKMVLSNGKIDEIPYIEGNAVRGYCRRLVMQDFIERIEYQITKPRLYHTLFSGGVLETMGSSDDGHVNLEMRRKIRNLIPPLSILGSTFGNQAFQGKMKVGKMLPFCSELSHILPEFENANSVFNYLDFSFQTRRDDREFEKEKDKQAIQMIVNFEVFIPGTVFHHWFSLDDWNEQEEGCFRHLIELWQSRPFIGGKSSTGHGEIKIDYPELKELTSSIVYFKFLDDNKEEIKEFLAELDK
ncbi:MAG: RAMP superfamily CRISPR-associated protein [Candidatus Kariarchaeaceae archaeon]